MFQIVFDIIFLSTGLSFVCAWLHHILRRRRKKKIVRKELVQTIWWWSFMMDVQKSNRNRYFVFSFNLNLQPNPEAANSKALKFKNFDNDILSKLNKSVLCPLCTSLWLRIRDKLSENERLINDSPFRKFSVSSETFPLNHHFKGTIQLK